MLEVLSFFKLITGYMFGTPEVDLSLGFDIF